MRSGALPLAVEVGRYTGIPEEQRLCVVCDLGVVEDEFHFMFHCPLYNNLRLSLFEKMQDKNPDLFWMSECHMLNWLFNKEVFVLAKFNRKGLAVEVENIVSMTHNLDSLICFSFSCFSFP